MVGPTAIHRFRMRKGTSSPCHLRRLSSERTANRNRMSHYEFWFGSFTASGRVILRESRFRRRLLQALQHPCRFRPARGRRFPIEPGRSLMRPLNQRRSPTRKEELAGGFEARRKGARFRILLNGFMRAAGAIPVERSQPGRSSARVSAIRRSRRGGRSIPPARTPSAGLHARRPVRLESRIHPPSSWWS